MNKKPTIILVHGFWGGAAHWSKVITDLSHRGYEALRAVELPLTSLADDVERTRKMIAQVQGDVLLVGHSYGGQSLPKWVINPMLWVWSILQLLHPMLVKVQVALRSNIYPLVHPT